MHDNDQAPTGDERDETSSGADEAGAAGAAPQAADTPVEELDGFAANDVAHVARLLPNTNVWSQIAASTRWLDQLTANTRWLSQITASTRAFDQIRTHTQALDQFAAQARVLDRLTSSAHLFDKVSAGSRVIERATRAASSLKWTATVAPLVPQITTAYQALDRLRIDAALPDTAWISAAVPDWKSWAIPASLGLWRVPTWTVPSSLAFTSAASQLATFALPQRWRCDLYDVLRRIRDRLAQADEYLGGLFFAALDARDAVLNDPDADKIVRRFARTWLGIRQVTRYVLDAVVDVLLSDDWHELDATEDELREHLRDRTFEQHALYRPVFERQLAGYPIGSLSAQVRTDDGTLTLDQAVAGSHDTEREVLDRQWTDPRIGPLLDKLAPHQRRVIDVITYDGLGWYQAADVAGVTPEEVEATRRRIRYLVAEQKRRSASR
jgi:hypothetical protein